MGSAQSHDPTFEAFYKKRPDDPAWLYDFAFLKVGTVSTLREAYTTYKAEYYPRANLTAPEITKVLQLRPSEGVELVERLGAVARKAELSEEMKKELIREQVAAGGSAGTAVLPKSKIEVDHAEGTRTINIYDALCLAVLRSQLITDSLKVRYVTLLHDFDR